MSAAHSKWYSKFLFVAGVAVLSLPGTVFAQEAGKTLTLDEALQLAKSQNGQVRAAFLNYNAARARTRGTLADFYPSITPNFRYETGRTINQTGSSTGSFDSVNSSSSITASWRLLDSGERDIRYKTSRISRDIQQFTTLQTLRRVLFDTLSKYYNVLRSDELLKVQDQQVERATELKNEAQARLDNEVGTRADVLQAQADYQNAVVSRLGALNNLSANRADLKAVLGISIRQELPGLVKPESVATDKIGYTLDEALRDGIDARPDLIAGYKGIDSQKQSLRLARLDSSITWSVDASYSKAFSPDVFENGSLLLVASFPVYDAGKSKEAVKSQEFALQSTVATYEQSVLDARAEIETAYKAHEQNIDRYLASKAALDAAKENYDAASGKFKEGAGTIIEAITAKVTLATAESNYITAMYDLLISEVNLRLVTGKPLPGEGN